MFKVSSNISKKSVKELINQDIKRFEIDGNVIMIAQVIISSVVEVKVIEDELQKELDKFTKENRLDLCVIAFTSILENGSIFYSAGEKKNAIFEAFLTEKGKNTVSRKIYYQEKIRLYHCYQGQLSSASYLNIRKRYSIHLLRVSFSFISQGILYNPLFPE